MISQILKGIGHVAVRFRIIFSVFSGGMLFSNFCSHLAENVVCIGPFEGGGDVVDLCVNA